MTKGRHKRPTTKGRHQSNHRALTFHRTPVVIMLIGLMALGTFIQVGNKVLRDAGAVAVPAQYLALSLDNPTKLPTHLPVNGPVKFRFTISSTKTTTVTQTWIVSVSATTTTKHQVAHGKVVLRPGAQVTIPVNFPLPTSQNNVAVTISAPGQHLAPLAFHLNASEGSGSS